MEVEKAVIEYSIGSKKFPKRSKEIATKVDRGNSLFQQPCEKTEFNNAN